MTPIFLPRLMLPVLIAGATFMCRTADLLLPAQCDLFAEAYTPFSTRQRHHQAVDTSKYHP